MTKVIVIKNADGSCDICHPVRPRFEDESEEQYYNTLAETTASGREWYLIEKVALPQDRTFRNAWKPDIGNVSVDMSKAREIWMDKIRQVRDTKLKQLDVETMKGRDVQKEKQVLRDIPQTYDLSGAATPEELQNLWPDVLSTKEETNE